QDGSAQGQRRCAARPQWHRHQESWRYGQRGVRLRHRHGLRHDALRIARQDQTDAASRAAGGRGCAPRRRGSLVIRSVVIGCGCYLPARVLTNEELALRVDTSDDWIVQRTGIHERRIAAEGETTSDLALHAARAALAHAKVDADSIDLIVLAT